MIKNIARVMFVVTAYLTCNSLIAFAEENIEKKVKQLESLLQTYIEENAELKNKIKSLSTPSFSNLGRENKRSLNSRCKSNASSCNTEELCALATYKLNNKTMWQKGIRKTFADEANRRSLTCGVNVKDKIINTSVKNKNNYPACKLNPAKCSPEELCNKATFKSDGQIHWKKGLMKNFVEEAKKLRLSCGVAKIVDTQTTATGRCLKDLFKCSEADLCQVATFFHNGNKKWKIGDYMVFVNEAKRRGLRCDVRVSKALIKSVEKPSTASQEPSTDLSEWSEEDLCQAATFSHNGNIGWKAGKYIIYVNEAKKRGLSCKVSEPKPVNKTRTTKNNCQELHQNMAKTAQKLGWITSAQANPTNFDYCMSNNVTLKDGPFLVYIHWKGILEYRPETLSSYSICFDLKTKSKWRTRLSECQKER